MNFFYVNRAGDFDAVAEDERIWKVMRTYNAPKTQRETQMKTGAIMNGANYVLIIDVVPNQMKFISQNQHKL